MTAQGWIQIAALCGSIVAITPLLGGYIARVFTGERVLLARAFGPAERGFYRVMRVDPEQEQDWKAYARAVLCFSLVSWLALYAILRLQGVSAVQPGGLRRRAVGRHRQHDLLVRDEHELAVLRG